MIAIQNTDLFTLTVVNFKKKGGDVRIERGYLSKELRIVIVPYHLTSYKSSLLPIRRKHLMNPLKPPIHNERKHPLGKKDPPHYS